MRNRIGCAGLRGRPSTQPSPARQSCLTSARASTPRESSSAPMHARVRASCCGLRCDYGAVCAQCAACLTHVARTIVRVCLFVRRAQVHRHGALPRPRLDAAPPVRRFVYARTVLRAGCVRRSAVHSPARATAGLCACVGLCAVWRALTWRASGYVICVRRAHPGMHIPIAATTTFTCCTSSWRRRFPTVCPRCRPRRESRVAGAWDCAAVAVSAVFCVFVELVARFVRLVARGGICECVSHVAFDVEAVSAARWRDCAYRTYNVLFCL